MSVKSLLTMHSPTQILQTRQQDQLNYTHSSSITNTTTRPSNPAIVLPPPPPLFNNSAPRPTRITHPQNPPIQIHPSTGTHLTVFFSPRQTYIFTYQPPSIPTTPSHCTGTATPNNTSIPHPPLSYALPFPTQPNLSYTHICKAFHPIPQPSEPTTLTLHLNTYTPR